MRSKWVWVLLVFLLLVIVNTGTSARDIRQGDTCTIEADEVITGNLFALCRTLIVNGTVEGNLFGAAINAEINGEVKKDAYVAAGQLDVKGTLGEDLVFGGIVLHVYDSTQFTAELADVINVNLSTVLDPEVTVPGSIVSLSYQLRVMGDVQGEISFWGSSLTIAGNVQGDVDASVGDSLSGNSSQVETLLVPLRFLNLEVHLDDPGLIIAENAILGGQLDYTASSPGLIEGELANEPVFRQVVTGPDFTQSDLTSEENFTWFSRYITNVIQESVTLALIGSLALLVLPRQIQGTLFNLRRRPLSSLGIGILTFILSFTVWIVILLLIVLIIFVLLALQLGDLVVISLMTIGVINIGGAGIFYFVAIYVSRVVVSLAIGRLFVLTVLKRSGTQPSTAYISMVVGAVIFGMLTWLPLIGTLIAALTLALGLGAITILVTRIQFREPPRPQPSPGWSVLPEININQKPLPPPIINDREEGPGMENLPKGFNWWEEENDN
ncbi:MAG: hypothetical protein K8L99_30195 [Anaerolineae bacterium]|nr:hypothetical protein [Anaerolineae bacterium]